MFALFESFEAFGGSLNELELSSTIHYRRHQNNSNYPLTKLKSIKIVYWTSKMKWSEIICSLFRYYHQLCLRHNFGFLSALWILRFIWYFQSVCETVDLVNCYNVQTWARYIFTNKLEINTNGHWYSLMEFELFYVTNVVN